MGRSNVPATVELVASSIISNPSAAFNRRIYEDPDTLKKAKHILAFPAVSPHR
jgi:hypothetical protein